MDRGFRYFIDQYTVEGARGKFEEFVTVLLKKTNNGEAFNVRASMGDEGIDVYIGDLNNSPDIYQCKFFFDGLNDSRKQKIRESIDTSLRKHKIHKWILCLPCQLNPNEHKWWCKFKNEYENKGIEKVMLFDEMQIITMAKECKLYEEYFNTVRVDKTFAETLYNEVRNVINTNDSQRENTNNDIMKSENCNLENGTFSYKTKHIIFFGFFPHLPERLVGSCSIEFQRYEVKDLVITLNHKQIFSLFELIEMRSKDYFYSDKFVSDNKIRFFIDNILILLVNEEVEDLLNILKNYSIQYITELKKVVSHFEIDKFDVSKEYRLGYHLFKIKIELWNLMKNFANEHDCLNGKSEWHMFNPNWHAINVFSPIVSHNPRYDFGMHAYFNAENTDKIGDNFIWLVLNMDISRDTHTRLEDYCERNIWGAITAYRWCINEFIPRIAEVYKINNINDYYDDFSISHKLKASKENVISDMQMFYMSNNIYITEKEMNNIKDSLIFCLSKKELPINEYDYILGKLGLRNITIKGKTSYTVAKEIIDNLSVRRYENAETRSSLADDILRCILAFVDDRAKNRLSEEEFSILISNISSLVIKMQDIEFLRRYSAFPSNE